MSVKPFLQEGNIEFYAGIQILAVTDYPLNYNNPLLFEVDGLGLVAGGWLKIDLYNNVSVENINVKYKLDDVTLYNGNLVSLDLFKNAPYGSIPVVLTTIDTTNLKFACVFTRGFAFYEKLEIEITDTQGSNSYVTATIYIITL